MRATFLLALMAAVGMQAQDNKKQEPPIITATNIIQPYDGPFVKIIAEHGEDPKDTKIIEIYRHQADDPGKPLVVVDRDGTVHLANGATPDEASKMFWKVLAENYPLVCKEALGAKP